jgi:DNA repair protein RecO (recombination protein O)
VRASEQIEAALRLFEIQLLQATGYGLQLVCDYLTQLPIQSSASYQYEKTAVGIKSRQNGI